MKIDFADKKYGEPKEPEVEISQTEITFYILYSVITISWLVLGLYYSNWTESTFNFFVMLPMNGVTCCVAVKLFRDAIDCHNVLYEAEYKKQKYENYSKWLKFLSEELDKEEKNGK